MEQEQSTSISVIIPAYNVQDWIARAIDSLRSQTLTDYEVILVDDGSTDGTPAFCDEFALSDKRIRVIHQRNSGAAAARNRALNEARGEFIYFMDADDWCEPSMLEQMFLFARDNQLDLVVCGFYIDTYYRDDRFFRELRTAPQSVYEDAQAFRNASWELFDAQLLYAPWNKLYRRSYLDEHNIRFPDTFWDDLPFNLEVIRNVERVGCMAQRFYHFLRARGESENTRYRPDMYSKREEEDAWLRDLYAQWELDTSEIREFLGRRYAERLLGCIENITCADCTLSKQEKYDEVAAMLASPRAQEALAVARPKTRMMAMLMAPMRAGNVSAVLRQSALISWVKRNSTNLFARLKAHR